jgi:predicted secreted protein
MSLVGETNTERAGKDLLLKLAEDITSSCTGGSVFTSSDHGLSDGDLIEFEEAVGTTFSISRFYFVVDSTVSNSSQFQLSLTPSGAALAIDGTDATVAMNAYKTIGGLRTKTFSYTAADIDVSNHGSNQWTNIKAGAGMRAVAISGAGVYTNGQNFRAMESAAFSQSLVALAFLDLVGGRIYEGDFKINSLEHNGEYDGEAGYSMSANSSGTVSISQLGT